MIYPVLRGLGASSIVPGFDRRGSAHHATASDETSTPEEHAPAPRARPSPRKSHPPAPRTRLAAISSSALLRFFRLGAISSRTLHFSGGGSRFESRRVRFSRGGSRSGRESSRAAIAAVRESELVPINVDVSHATTTILAALPRIEPFAAELATLPGYDPEWLAKLERYTLALYATHGGYLAAARRRSAKSRTRRRVRRPRVSARAGSASRRRRSGAASPRSARAVARSAARSRTASGRGR